MMSLDQIRSLSDEQAKRASAKKREPYVPFSREEVENYPPFPFPNIGSYKPLGWKEINYDEVGLDGPFFVDKSGFGARGEPALTAKDFKDTLLEFYDKLEGCGFAIIEEGQFQLYVGVFKKVKK